VSEWVHTFFFCNKVDNLIFFKGYPTLSEKENKLLQPGTKFYALADKKKKKFDDSVTNM
jgi:hypothetical protein